MNHGSSDRALGPSLRSRERGVALIAVLWVVLLLSVIAGSLLLLTRSDLDLSRNLVLSSRAESLAEGGIYLGILALLDPDPETRWVPDGRSYRLVRESGTLDVSLQDETGRIDLNGAPPELLSSLLASAGVEAEQVDILANRIIDWRDPDDEARPNGAEQDDYDAAGLEIRVGNRPFMTSDEVQRVPGVTTDLYARIAPAVTVYSGRPGINPGTAPRAALLALPGIDEATVDAVLAARTETSDSGGLPMVAATAFGASAALLPAESRRFLTGGATNVFSIRSRATLDEGAVYVQEAVVEVLPGSDPPWRIHAWRMGESIGSESISANPAE